MESRGKNPFISALVLVSLVSLSHVGRAKDCENNDRQGLDLALSTLSRSQPSIREVQLNPLRPPSSSIPTAIHRSRNAATSSPGIEKLIIQKIAHDSLNFIEHSSKYQRQPKEIRRSPECLSGSCGLSQADVYFRTRELLSEEGITEAEGYQLILRQSAQVFNGAPHAFTVVKFPSGRMYLIDPTVGQYFRSRTLGHAPEFIDSHPDVSRTLRPLLENGYMELTDATANAYGRALKSVLEPEKAETAQFDLSTILKGLDDPPDLTLEEWNDLRIQFGVR